MSSDIINATGRRWVLPYREIVERLRRGGRARVILSSEGEATDLVYWARSRGYRIVRHLRTAAGIEVTLEAPKPSAPPKPAPAPAAEAAPAPAGGHAATPAAAPAATPRQAAPTARGPGESLDVVSRRMADPLFKVDLLLVATSLKAGSIEGSTSLEALAGMANEATGGGCAYIEATHSSGASMEVLTCGESIEGVLLRTPQGQVLEGRRALDEASRILGGGRLEYRIMSIDKSFVEKLRS